MQNLDLFDPVPQALIRRVDLALACLKDGPEKGVFDAMALAIRSGTRIMIFDLNIQDGHETLEVLEDATRELRSMLPPKDEEA